MKTILTTLVAMFAISSSTFAATFNMKGLGADLNGWTKKKNTASEYKSADSNYRTYKPTVSPTPGGGLFISTKINHIRGGWGTDDHCILELTFDAEGTLVSSRAQIKIGKKDFDTKIITGSAALAGASAGTTAAVAVGLEIGKKLAHQIAVWNEHGGRGNFPNVVKHNINLIARNVKP